MWGFYLILSVVSGHFIQMETFCQVHLVIARASDRSGATRAVTLGIRKTFERVWHNAAFVKKLKPYGIPGQSFDFTIAIFQ